MGLQDRGTDAMIVTRFGVAQQAGQIPKASMFKEGAAAPASAA
jgi:hypothetical protein